MLSGRPPPVPPRCLLQLREQAAASVEARLDVHRLHDEQAVMLGVCCCSWGDDTERLADTGVLPGLCLAGDAGCTGFDCAFCGSVAAAAFRRGPPPPKRWRRR